MAARIIAREGIPATARQEEFLAELAAEVHGDNAPEFILAHREGGTFDDRAATSRVIDALMQARKDMRARARAADDRRYDDVEPGYYATEYQGVLRFYRVAEGKGRWAGRTWLNRFRSDELGRVGRDEAVVVRKAIAADPLGAGMLFARELTRCRVCGRMLTDEKSRALGIGPDCRGER